jgi:hypothetical protein
MCRDRSYPNPNTQGGRMNLEDIESPYIPAAKTDILRTLKRTGWVPPSENREYQKKWEYYRSIAFKNERKLK